MKDEPVRGVLESNRECEEEVLSAEQEGVMLGERGAYRENRPEHLRVAVWSRLEEYDRHVNRNFSRPYPKVRADTDPTVWVLYQLRKADPEIVGDLERE